MIAAGIGEPVAGLCKRRRQAVLRIPPGIAVGVIGEQAAHDFVGRRRIPEREKRPDDVLKRAKTLEPEAILAAVVATDYKSIVGPVKWTGQPVKNVTKTPLVAGQWQRKDDRFDLVITTNKTAPEIPVGGQLQLLS